MVKQESKDDFYFAVAVTPVDSSYKEFSAEKYLFYGNMSIEFVITGGPRDGETRKIGMKPCENYDFVKPHYLQR